MEEADCTKLEELNHEVKHAFFLTGIYLQRPGYLSAIVGPDCTFLGETQELATITDNSLTIGAGRELLYYIPEMNALIVSHTETNAIAYGIFIEDTEEDLDPLAYFLEHRDEAELSAVTAKSYAESVQHIVLPTFDPDTPREPVIREVSQKSSSESSQKTARFNPQENPTEPLVPTIPDKIDTNPVAMQTPDDNALPEQPTLPDVIEPDKSDVVYSDTPSDTLPSIQPIGPVPQATESSQGIGYWVIMIFLTLALIATAVIILRSRASAKDSYQDD